MTIPDTMRAAVLVGHGDADKLHYRENYPTPKIAAGEVLIRVRACGLNNTDINTRVGWYAKDAASGNAGGWGGAINFPRIQGADAVGIVAAAGDAAGGELIGNRVMVDTWLRDWDDPHNAEKAGYFGSECDGGFAEYTKVDRRQVHPVSSDLSDAELATFATSYATAENMLRRAVAGANDTILITGASGGVGSALIQLARYRGAQVVAVCAAEKSAAICKLGATAAVPRTANTAEIRAVLKKTFGRNTVTVVADVVGGDQWPQWIELIARGGRYVCSGAVAGAAVRFDLRPFYLRDLTFAGATVAPPGLFANLVRYIETGAVRPLLAATYPLEKIAEAQEKFMKKDFIGNIAVCP